MAKGTKGTKSKYETQTPEKIAFGARMRHAREEAGVSQERAAKELGYAQPVQLSLMETGKRPVTMGVLVKAAELYGTTTDYLCGLAPDVDRDPAVSVQRQLTARISNDVQRLIDEVAVRSVEIARNVLPQVSDGARLAAATLDAHAALLRFVELNPTFIDRGKGGSLLMGKAEVAANLARAYAAHVERGRRVLAARTIKPDDRAAAERSEQLSMLPLFDLSPMR